MAKKKLSKKFLFILLGVGAAAFGFLWGSPKRRFKRDASNPGTAWGKEVQDYLGANYTADAIAATVAYHIENNTPQFQAYKKKGWAIKQ